VQRPTRRTRFSAVTLCGPDPIGSHAATSVIAAVPVLHDVHGSVAHFVQIPAIRETPARL
jgi:hypothetical protein